MIIGITVSLIWVNADVIKTNTQVYTAEQMKESYLEGVKEGNKHEEELVFKINTLSVEISKLNEKINKLTPLEEENEVLSEEKRKLEIKVQELQSELDSYKALLPEVDSNNLACIYFYVDNEIYKTISIFKETTVPLSQIPIIEKWGYKFNGWVLEDLTAVDFTTQTFSTNTNVYANFVEHTKLTIEQGVLNYTTFDYEIPDVIRLNTQVNGLKAGDKIYLKIEEMVFDSNNSESYALANNMMVYNEYATPVIYDSELYNYYLKPDEKISYKDNMKLYRNEFEIYAECIEDDVLSICIDYKEDSKGFMYFLISYIRLSEIFVER